MRGTSKGSAIGVVLLSLMFNVALEVNSFAQFYLLKKEAAGDKPIPGSGYLEVGPSPKSYLDRGRSRDTVIKRGNDGKDYAYSPFSKRWVPLDGIVNTRPDGSATFHNNRVETHSRPGLKSLGIVPRNPPARRKSDNSAAGATEPQVRDNH